MKKSTILSNNKENDKSMQLRSPNLKMNYLDKQKFTGISPLKQTSLNRYSYQIQNRSKYSKSPLEGKNNQKSYKYIDQSLVSPFKETQNNRSQNRYKYTNLNLDNKNYMETNIQSQQGIKLVNQKTITREQSSSDLSKIRPFSILPAQNKKQIKPLKQHTSFIIQNQQLKHKNYQERPVQRKLDEKNIKEEINSKDQKDPVIKETKDNPSISRQRQKSKHLQFSAKVNNLQKINNQITSLLNYVNLPKSQKKQEKLEEKNQNYKPRYQIYSENNHNNERKRRISHLETPKQFEFNISKFQLPEKSEDKSVAERKNGSQRFFNKEEYQQNGNKSNKEIQISQESIAQLRNKRKSLRPRHSNHVRLEQKTQNSYSIRSFKVEEQKFLPSVKSQQFPQKMNPSQSEDKLSKITSNQNQDLQFYYESLKKRDQQIDRFKKKLFDSIDNKSKKQPLQQAINNKQPTIRLEGDSLAQKYLFPLNRRKNSYLYNNSNTKKDIFVTQQQIQMYKDMSRKKLYSCSTSNRDLKQTYQKKQQEKQEKIQKKEQNKIQNQTPKADKVIQIQPRKSKYDYQSQINMKENYQDQIKIKDYQQTHSQIKYQRPQLSNRSLNHSQISKMQASNRSRRNSVNRIEERQQKRQQIQQPQQKLQSKIAHQLDEQISKIKNQLKQCKRQKNFLKEKYSKIINQDISMSPQQCNTARSNQSKRNSSLYHKNSNQKRQQRSGIKNNKEENLLRYDNYGDDQRIYASSKSIKRSFQPEVIHFENQQFNERNNYQQFDTESMPVKFAKTIILKDNLPYQRQQIHLSKIQQVFQTVDLKKPSQSPKQRSPQKAGNIPSNISRSPRKDKKQFQIKLQKVQITKPQTTRLGTYLSEKIQIDLKLRQERQKFNKWSEQKKWKMLQNHLEKNYNITKTVEQWEQLLKICPEEHNPFLNFANKSNNPSPNNRSQQYSRLLNNSISSSTMLVNISQLIYKSLNYFQNNLLHKFSSQNLKRQNFSFKYLDLSSKGYISLEDLVCFINLHSGKFYRNRDIIFMVKQILGYGDKQKPLSGRLSKDKGENTSQRPNNAYKLQYIYLWNLFIKN